MSTDAAQKRGIKVTIACLLAFICLVLVLFINKITTPRHLSKVELQINGAIEFDTPRRFADINLINHRGEKFENSDLKDKWTLIFFGFTHCPDVCPTTMASLAAWYELLDEDVKANTQVVMVSVDPERDSAAKLAEYVPYFNKDFMGATGSLANVQKFAAQLYIAFTKVQLSDDYTVDHSAQIALINPRGDYHGFFKPPIDNGKMKLTFMSIRQAFKG